MSTHSSVLSRAVTDLRRAIRVHPSSFADCDRRTLVLLGSAWSVALTLIAVAWMIASATARDRGEALVLSSYPGVPIIKETPLMPDETEAMLKTLSTNYSGITFRSGKDNSVVISATASDTDTYERWIAALSAIQGAGENVRWNVKNLCAGLCKDAVFTATLSGVRISLPPR